MDCWLCKHSLTPAAKLAQAYMSEHSGSICPEVMAMEMARLTTIEVQKDFPEIVLSTEMCHLHLTTHTLTPQVRLSTMLRSLLTLSDDMAKSLHTYDADGNPVLDPKLIETYLKLQNQIINIYKQSETSKMLFSDKSA